ncbi:hypothetical protein [Pedobacter sp. SYSU D00535]|uniref:hypothetical protein n=1 Tax=Pedobacter sp. SYSU D00535 TaxID=2810308 RepID=UPI001A957140|nr:hypothetical protein [Pedobacter sp. SYSU D00535]
MKGSYFKIIAAIILPAFIACSSSNNNNQASTDSTMIETEETAQAQGSYVNLNTGEPVAIVMNSENQGGVSSAGSASGSGSTSGSGSATAGGSVSGSGSAGSLYVYADTRQPIEADMLFVDVSTGDTLYGPSGIKVNNAIRRNGERWELDNAKIERRGDEIKIKSGNEKIKIDGDDMKYKSGDSKLKVDDGEEFKSKTPTTKEKVEEDGETTVKPR